MGEIDEKPVDPVQTTIAVSFTDEITSDDNQQKFCPTWKDNQVSSCLCYNFVFKVLSKNQNLIPFKCYVWWPYLLALFDLLA